MLMPHHSKIISFLICFCVVSISRAAGWTTFTKIDEITDEKTRFAKIENSDCSFFLYTETNSYTKKNNYIGGFWLTGNRFSLIHYEPKLITIRIDKYQPHNIFYSSWEPTKIYFVLTNERKLIDEMMNGTTMIVQYPTSRTQRRIEKFTLSGSANAIKTALLNYKNEEEYLKESTRIRLEQHEKDMQEKRKEQEFFKESRRIRLEQFEKDMEQRRKENEKSGQQFKIQHKKQNNEYRLKIEKNAKLDCPKDWELFIELEKKHGTQVWQGCGYYTESIPVYENSGYGERFTEDE